MPAIGETAPFSSGSFKPCLNGFELACLCGVSVCSFELELLQKAAETAPCSSSISSNGIEWDSTLGFSNGRLLARRLVMRIMAASTQGRLSPPQDSMQASSKKSP